MADWKKWPSGWGEMAQEGVNKEMPIVCLNKEEKTKRSSKWRDDGLIELLKFLKKL